MNQYAIYLRKSRADLEAEARGEGETLARHRAALRALAKRRGLNVIQEYSEVVTGDSIAARPQMQLLLDDVKHGMYAGVIVNDVDRLGRGDSIDQEIIKYAFVAGHCLIITPTRDINPASPSDQDMLDFSLFFARFEYRKIAHRLTQGRTRSASSGNYICSRVPYGYKKVVDGKRITLVPDEETSGVVKMIYDWYASRQYGYYAIANKLNDMGYKTYRGYDFSRGTVKKILQNPIYTGRILWGKTMTISAIEDGHRSKKHIKSDPTIVENAHPAIISDETFNAVQKMFEESNHAAPKHTQAELRNCLSGLLYCSKCGKAMSMRGGRYRNGTDRTVACLTRGCPTYGTYIGIIVDIVLETLHEWCAVFKVPQQEQPIRDNSQTEHLKRQIATIEAQITKAQELVELGVYTPSEYIQRRDELNNRIKAIQTQLNQEQREPIAQTINTMIPQIERVLEAFPLAASYQEQNELLKTVIARIDYTKTKMANKSVSPESLVSLEIHPRIGNIM